MYAVFYLNLKFFSSVGTTRNAAVSATPTNQDNNTITNDYKMKSHITDILRGRDGRDGLPGTPGGMGDKGKTGPQGIQEVEGPQGPPGPVSGGVVYTRWRRTICPDTNGTVLVYEGLAAGSHFTQSGGEANYICITKTPSYVRSTVPLYYSFLYGSEYEFFVFNSLNDHNVPCAVCYTAARSSKLMSPGETTCPSMWS